MGDCPNGHHSVADDGMCNVTTCGHCDPVVSKPTRTGNGKAPDGRPRSAAGWASTRRSRRPDDAELEDRAVQDKPKRWVYGRADDRFMDEDRLNDTAANLENAARGRRQPDQRGGCWPFALAALLTALVTVAALLTAFTPVDAVSPTTTALPPITQTSGATPCWQC